MLQTAKIVMEPAGGAHNLNPGEYYFDAETNTIFLRRGGASSVRLGPKTITANGVYYPAGDNLDGFNSVDVQVPGITPTGTIQITENGTHNVAQYANANVQVPGATPTGTIQITENGTYDVTQYAGASVNVSGGTPIYPGAGDTPHFLVKAKVLTARYSSWGTFDEIAKHYLVISPYEWEYAARGFGGLETLGTQRASKTLLKAFCTAPIENFIESARGYLQPGSVELPNQHNISMISSLTAWDDQPESSSPHNNNFYQATTISKSRLGSTGPFEINDFTRMAYPGASVPTLQIYAANVIKTTYFINDTGNSYDYAIRIETKTVQNDGNLGSGRGGLCPGDWIVYLTDPGVPVEEDPYNEI